MAKEKVVLAYSGGLDTSIIIPWLKENYDYEVIAVCGDVGQGKETEGLEEKRSKPGQASSTSKICRRNMYVILSGRRSRPGLCTRASICSVPRTRVRVSQSGS